MIVYDNISGHHVGYASFLSKLFDVEKVEYSYRKLFYLVWTKKNVFFVTIDEHFFAILFISMLRQIQGLRTSGIHIGSTRLKERNAKTIIKKLILSLLLRLNKVTIISLVSFEYLGNLSFYYKDFIFDPMFCDLGWHGYKNSSVPGKRSDIIVLGFLTREKGMDEIGELARSFPSLSFYHYGKIQEDDTSKLIACNNFKTFGAFPEHLIDSVLTRHKLPIMWCKFSQKYDLSSGAFGKAMQYGIPVYTSGNSYLAYLAVKFNLLRFDDVLDDKLIGSKHSNEMFYELSLAKLKYTLVNLV